MDYLSWLILGALLLLIVVWVWVMWNSGYAYLDETKYDSELNSNWVDYIQNSEDSYVSGSQTITLRSTAANQTIFVQGDLVNKSSSEVPVIILPPAEKMNVGDRFTFVTANTPDGNGECYWLLGEDVEMGSGLNRYDSYFVGFYWQDNSSMGSNNAWVVKENGVKVWRTSGFYAEW